MSIITETITETVRRLQLLGIPADVVPGLISYVQTLNAKRLAQADQYPHLLDSSTVTDEHKSEHAERYGFGDSLTGPSPMRYMDDCETCAAGDGFPRPTLQALRSYFDVDPGATSAGKYIQVVVMSPSWRTGEMSPDSVHSVVVKADGRVCKPAGWKAGPAKSTARATKGQLLSQYDVVDPYSLSALREAADVNGGYLYSR